MLIPVLGILFTGLTIFSITPLGRALARRLSGVAPEFERRVDALERDLEATRHELAETHERLDFAERSLAQVREGRRLPPG
jgi:hypothetical protein